MQAIFSDDSDDEGDTSSLNKVEDPEKKVEAANTTLNRLMAGDFLESLGKELGLEVPPDLAYAMSNARTSASQKEIVNSSLENAKIPLAENKASSSTFASGESLINRGDPHPHEKAEVGRYDKNEFVHGNSAKGNSKRIETVSLGTKYDNVSSEKDFHEERKAKTSLSQNRSLSSSLLSEDKSRKHSRRHQHRNGISDPSSDDQGGHHSRSKGRRKSSSSREKSGSSKKQSKYHKHRSRDSHSRSHYATEQEHAEGNKEKHNRS